MEEILYGCKLARQLELNLVNLVGQPDMLSSSIDEIVKAFTAAQERLSLTHHQYQAPSFSHVLPQEAFNEEEPQMGARFFRQEWPRSSFPQRTDHLIQRQQVKPRTTPFSMPSFLDSKMGVEIGRDAEGSERSKGSEGEVHPGEASSSRQRRRKNEAHKEVVLPINQFGNPETVEDGFTWRKYGQKEILGSNYPRSYYRCTHQKLYACPAKKMVQRVDDSPDFLRVTYRGKHICHMSSTAPSFVPSQLLMDISKDMMTQNISPQMSLQSSMQLSLHSGGGGGGGSIAPAGGDARAGPSTSMYGRDHREIDYGVADMADAMFINVSGSSSGNSMESLLIPPTEESEAGKKKSS